MPQGFCGPSLAGHQASWPSGGEGCEPQLLEDEEEQAS